MSKLVSNGTAHSDLNGFKQKDYVFLFWCLLFSFLIPLTLGMNYSFYGVLGNFFLLLWFKLIHRWLFVVAVFLLTLTCAFFLPLILFYGELTETMIFSAFETNASETKEFFLSLPWYGYVLSILMILFGIWLCRFSFKISFALKYKVHFLVGLPIIIVFITLYKPYEVFKKEGKFELANSRTSAISFYIQINSWLDSYNNFLNEVKQSFSEESSWEIIKSQPKYNTYVLVIGESVRSDYMSAYGYPHQNTPFMQSVNGCVLEGYTSAGFNTIASLMRTLKQSENGKIIHKNNIVSLAKKAGFKVYWLSNQGRIGEHDT